MAMKVLAVFILMTSSVGVLGNWKYNYDILRVKGYVVPHYYNHTTVYNECECRALCVEWAECSAYSIFPLTEKAGAMTCYYSDVVDVQYNLTEGDGIYTYFKERKPKRYFVTDQRHDSMTVNKFYKVCQDEGGHPGFIRTVQDWHYVKDHIQPNFDDWMGPLLPLYRINTPSGLWTWLNTTAFVDPDSPFPTDISEMNDNDRPLTTLTNSMVFRGQRSSESAHILCFKYDENP